MEETKGNRKQEKSLKETRTQRTAAKKSASPGNKTETGIQETEGKKAQEKKSRKPGADLLEEAANEEVKRRSAELAKGLADAAAKGNASCAKVLVTLSEKSRMQKKEAKGKKGRSQALALASEPDWIPPAETGVKTGFDEREPAG